MQIFWANPVKNSFKTIFFLAIATSATLFIANGVQWRTQWDQIESRGRLTVAVRESEGIYWANGQEFTGFENDLLNELERHLEIPIQIIAVRDLDDLYRSLEVGAVDMAIPGTSHGNLTLMASRPYFTTTIGLVSTKSDSKESTDLRLGILDPIAHQDVLTSIEPETDIENLYVPGRLSTELFTLIDLNELDQVLVDERDFQLQQSIFPNLSFTPINDEKRPVSILFGNNEDGTVSEKVNQALDLIEHSGLMTQMIDRYYGEALEFDYVDNLTFEKHMASRLPNYADIFRKYGAEHGLDWRLLAAVAYQESHWRANARSPTGVRGLMMVTLTTAREIGISNRLDPDQSTMAGAQYLMSLKDRIPERITDPDRTWFALASYNVGLGHLEDARRITEALGDDPDRWLDVRKHLPKLSLKDYYPWTRYGYARGAEPVVYVANIRRFYERLVKEFPEEGEKIEPERLDQLPEATVPVFPAF